MPRLLAALAACSVAISLLSDGTAAQDPPGYDVTSEGVVVGQPHLGDPSDVDLTAPTVDVVPIPNGGGYWVMAADTGVFAFGDARFRGNLYTAAPGAVLAAPIVAGAAATSGGYWLAAADGGVFAFGARFLGSITELLPDHHRLVDIAPGDGGYVLTDNAGNEFLCTGHCTIRPGAALVQLRPTICDQGPGDGLIGWDDIDFILAVQAHVRPEWHCWLVRVAACESNWNRQAVNGRSSASGYMQFLRQWWGDRLPGDPFDPTWQARSTQYLLDNGGTSHWQCR